MFPNKVRYLRKSITFTGAAGLGAIGQNTVVTPSGIVLIKKIVPVCVLDLGASGGAATISLGISTAVASLIAATVATTIDTGEYWVDNTGVATLLALPVALQTFLLNVPITLDVLVFAVDSGTLVFDIEYESINGGALS